MDIWSGKNFSQDLSDYISIIEKHYVGSLFDVRKLYEYVDKIPFEDYCLMDEIELEFVNYKPISQTNPKITHFRVNLLNTLASKPNIDPRFIDPIDKCSFEIIVTGFCDAVDGAEYKMAWHLDKDEGEGCGPHKYTHPLYHFQYGGKRVYGLPTGGMMLMGAPRLPHPPMDIFLSIHFVLNNFFNKEEEDFSCLKDLFSDFDYLNILEKAKKRMWYPYFKGLNDQEMSHPNLNLASLFPLAV